MWCAGKVSPKESGGTSDWHIEAKCHLFKNFNDAFGEASNSTGSMDNTSAAYQGQLAHWDDDREPKFVAVSVFLIVATCLAIAVRFWAQRKIKKQWALDNIVIFFAAVRLLLHLVDPSQALNSTQIFAVGVTIACIVGMSISIPFAL